MNNNVTYNGLTASQVEESRSKHGSNILTPAKKTPIWQLYLEKYQDPIIRILLVAAAISLVLAFIKHEYIETIGIFIAIFLATTVGFIFELDAARKFDVLTQLNEDQPIKVVRDGKVCLVMRKDIVVGDIVIIETGDEVPADGILITATSLQIDESMLTGEPITSKTAEQPGDDEANAATYQKNMVMRSTMVMNGNGVIKVTAVGDSTEIGHVARTSAEETAVETPLNLQLNRLGSLINKAGTSLSMLAFLLFLIHDILVNPLWHTNDYLAMAEVVLKYFMMAVTLIVMAVPEGLPMAVTLALALNMRRMLKSNNLVRKLHACETMGAVTVICTDKTGTLTENRMRVQHMEVAGDESLFDTAIAVNTTAHLSDDSMIGNPTEVALLLWMRDRGVDYRTLRHSHAVVAQQPFSTERKYMSTTVVIDGTETTFVKGAPEIVMQQCQLTDAERDSINRSLLAYQQQAMRTLAFACNGRWQGIAAIADPLRQDVPGAVAQCHSAGIKVKVVTGDVEATAVEIWRQIMGRGGKVRSITGSDFSRLSDAEAQAVVADLDVMSRARPADKQRLVQLLQQNGEVVAVTGDGTNDAPALNHAHVGLSLGSGTNVAKEASDMTLLDDSFASIVRAVMWGRSLYRNIQRFLFFQLVVNVAALMLVLAGSLIGTELPLTVTQILWVNLIMDTLAAMALASLPPSREVMADKPRKQTDFILTPHIVRSILTYGLMMFAVMFVFLLELEYSTVTSWLYRLGLTATTYNGSHIEESTIFFTTFVMMQTWNLFNAKALNSRHSAFRRLYADRGLLIVLVSIVFGQWLIVTFGGEMFRCVPLSLTKWIVIILATAPVALVPEAVRKIKRS